MKNVIYCDSGISRATRGKPRDDRIPSPLCVKLNDSLHSLQSSRMAKRYLPLFLEDWKSIDG